MQVNGKRKIVCYACQSSKFVFALFLIAFVIKYEIQFDLFFFFSSMEKCTMANAFSIFVVDGMNNKKEKKNSFLNESIVYYSSFLICFYLFIVNVQV